MSNITEGKMLMSNIYTYILFPKGNKLLSAILDFHRLSQGCLSLGWTIYFIVQTGSFLRAKADTTNIFVEATSVNCDFPGHLGHINLLTYKIIKCLH